MKLTSLINCDYGGKKHKRHNNLLIRHNTFKKDYAINQISIETQTPDKPISSKTRRPPGKVSLQFFKTELSLYNLSEYGAVFWINHNQSSAIEDF